MLGFLLLSLAWAEPQFTQLKEGEPAPFDGRLLNDEAIVQIAVTDKYKVQQCDLQIVYERQKLEALQKFEIEKAKIELNAQYQIYENKVALRDVRIKELEKLSKPIQPVFVAAAGFLVGAGSTIGILYAVY